MSNGIRLNLWTRICSNWIKFSRKVEPFDWRWSDLASLAEINTIPSSIKDVINVTWGVCKWESKHSHRWSVRKQLNGERKAKGFHERAERDSRTTVWTLQFSECREPDLRAARFHSVSVVSQARRQASWGQTARVSQAGRQARIPISPGWDRETAPEFRISWFMDFHIYRTAFSKRCRAVGDRWMKGGAVCLKQVCNSVHFKKILSNSEPQFYIFREINIVVF